MDGGAKNMKDTDKKYFLVLMATLEEAFKEEMSPERGKLYFEFLNKYSLYEVTSAVEEAIRSLKFFPKIGELCQLIGISISRWRDSTDNATLDAGAIKQIAVWGSIIGPRKEERVALPYKERTREIE